MNDQPQASKWASERASAIEIEKIIQKFVRKKSTQTEIISQSRYIHSLPEPKTLVMRAYSFHFSFLPTAWTIYAKNHKCTNYNQQYAYAISNVPSFRTNVDLLLAKWCFLCCFFFGLYVTRPCYTFSYIYIHMHTVWYISLRRRWFFFIGIFIFVFIKLPVCKSPSQNHDLFYVAQMVRLAVVVVVVSVSSVFFGFWFGRSTLFICVCLLGCFIFSSVHGLVIFSYHFMHLPRMLDLICSKCSLLHWLWIIDSRVLLCCECWSERNSKCS